MSGSLSPKRRENTWFSRKTKISTFLHLIFTKSSILDIRRDSEYTIECLIEAFIGSFNLSKNGLINFGPSFSLSKNILWETGREWVVSTIEAAFSQILRTFHFKSRYGLLLVNENI